MIKRFFDFIFSIIFIILLSPVFAIIAIVVKSTSKGPVIFKQKRMGHNQKIFTFYKFRVMVKGAEKLKDKYRHLDFTDGPVFKIRGDPRLTKIGSYLSKTNLDELPQLFNILKGDMSFVGFRPPTLDEVEKYKEWHLKRFKGYAGLTSLWAVSGMHKISFDDWIRLDIEYNKNISFVADLKIILRTFLNFFSEVL